jgi:hypothetical protein
MRSGRIDTNSIDGSTTGRGIVDSYGEASPAGRVTGIACHFLLALLAALLTVSFVGLFTQSPDYGQYEMYFQDVASSGFEIVVDNRFEPLFSIVSAVIASFVTSPVAIYGVFLFTAIMIKLEWLYKLEVANRSGFYSVFVALTFLAFRYGPLHELTQIRTAIAAGILLFAYSVESRRKTYILLAVASLFHYTCVLFIFIDILSDKFISVGSTGKKIFCFLFFMITILVVQFDVVEVIWRTLEIGADYSKTIALYNITGYGEQQANPLSLAVAIDLSFVVVCLVFHNRLSSRSLKILIAQIIGLFIYVVARDFPVLAHRMRELIAVLIVVVLYELSRGNSACRVIAGIFSTANAVLFLYIYTGSENAIL